MAEILERRIDLLILDPFVSCHDVPENDNGAVDRVTKTWAALAEAATAVWNSSTTSERPAAASRPIPSKMLAAAPPLSAQSAQRACSTACPGRRLRMQAYRLRPVAASSGWTTARPTWRPRRTRRSGVSSSASA